MALTRPVGLIPGIITTFKENYELDEDGFRAHLKWLLTFPELRGWSITSGTGEFYSLTLDEFRRCQEIGVEMGHGIVQVWSNFGAESFEKTLAMAEVAREAGVDGLRIIHPYYARYSQEILYDYFRDLAKALSDISIMIYPQLEATGRPFPVETIIRLSEIDNIVGVKVAHGPSIDDLVKLDVFTKERSDKFAIVSGRLSYFYHFCRSGIQTKAAIGPHPQVAPELCIDFWNACISEKWDEALRILKVLLQWQATLQMAGGNHPASLKYALKLLGHPVGPTRRPNRMPTPEEGERIRNGLVKADLLRVPLEMKS